MCLATLPLDGAGPLVSLSPINCTTLLCASFTCGLHHIQLGQVVNQGQGSGTSGTGGLDIKVVARFWLGFPPMTSGTLFMAITYEVSKGMTEDQGPVPLGLCQMALERIRLHEVSAAPLMEEDGASVLKNILSVRSVRFLPLQLWMNKSAKIK